MCDAMLHLYAIYRQGVAATAGLASFRWTSPEQPGSCYHQWTSSKAALPASASCHGRAGMYFHPLSENMTTMLPWSIPSATLSAAWRAAPEDAPAKIPSKVTTSLTRWKDDAVSTK